MNVRPIQKATNERSEATRRRLIDAGTQLFSTYGYEATTTRALADAAGANLAAIPYHFGGKDGLYKAVAQAIVEDLDRKMGGFLADVQKEIDAGITSPAQAMALVEKLVADFAEIVLVSPDAESWMSFIMREQMDPTEVFAILYESPICRMRGIFRTLLSHVSGLEPENPRLRLVSMELLGLIYVFRVARASTLREMDWDSINGDAFKQIRNTVLESARAILKSLQAH